MSRRTFDRIPGLAFYPDYFNDDQCSQLVSQSLRLYDRLEEQLLPETERKIANVPQPAFVRSAKHNLQSEEFYSRLHLVEAGERTIRCEYFPRYGEDGHALCYFKGNANLPDFVRDGLLDVIHQTIQRDALVKPDQALTWKLTMNFYKNVGGKTAGFPFHVDVPSNGVVTMILNVQKEVLFQIAKDDFVQDVGLPVGCLLLLSGESRYEWKHRVLPRDAPHADEAGKVERVSLVLGFQ